MVNISGIDWKIYLVSSNHPKIQRDDGTFALGCCDTDTKKIYVYNKLNDKYFKKVLYHELVHAYIYSYKIILNENYEEILADLIATYGEEIVSMTNFIINKNKGEL